MTALVDLTPAPIRRAVERRRRRGELVAAVAVAVTAACAGVGAGAIDADRQREAAAGATDALKVELAEAEAQIAGERTLLAALGTELDRRRSSASGQNWSALLEFIERCCPADVSLERVEITATPANAQSGLKLRLTLRGIAPNLRHVSRVRAALETPGVFDRVLLGGVQPIEGSKATRFTIECSTEGGAAGAGGSP